MIDSTVLVACCQVSLMVGDILGNRARVHDAIVTAADAGARVIVLPELANVGYMFDNLAELRALAEPSDGASVRDWELLARERDLVIVAGFAEAGDDDRVYNSAVIVDKTGRRANYRKAHLWDREKDNLFTAGFDSPPVVDTTWGRIGVVICYDLEFPEWVRVAALEGAELLCCPVNWPLYPRPAAERPTEIVKVQANAAVNRMFIAIADRTGTERGQDWLGGSIIVDTDGFPVTQITLGKDALLLAALDLADARLKSISDHNDVHADRRPSLYTRVTES